MLLLLANIALAQAQECPNVQDSVDQAYVSFEDAETDLARKQIRQAYQSLGCQQEPVPTAALMELYHLDALTALSAEDVQGATYATIRAISANPNVSPPQSMGPEIAEMHATWSARLKDSKVMLIVDDAEASFWVDGVPLATGTEQLVVEGEHLLQVMRAGVMTSEVVEVSTKLSGADPWNLRIVSPVNSTPEAVSNTVDKAPKKPKRQSKGAAKWGVTLTGAAIALGGGAVLGLGAYEEQQFTRRAYAPESYDSEGEREGAIRDDAAKVNQLYILGYGLVGVGLATTSIGFFAIPVSDGGGLGVRARW